MEFTANWTPIKYQQTEKYRLENADGTFADYNTIIDEERDFDSTVDAWNRAEDDTYQAASIDSYRVATASEISVDVKRHTSHNTMSYRFENSDGTYSDYEVYADGRYRVGEKISYHYDESDIYEGIDAEYTVTREDHVEGVDIKRKSYNITFETDEGEAVESITEKAGKKIELPSTVKTGYIFTGWYLDADLTQPVTELTVTKDVTLYAGWQAMTGIPYTVNHYKEDLTGEYPATPSEIERFDSTTGKKETPDVKDYEGFTAPKTKTIKVKGDGSSSVDYFYKRNSHKLTLTAGNGIETISEGGTFKYGEEVTVKAVVKTGYIFNGWEGDIESKDAEYTFIMPDKDITMTAMTNADLYTIDYELNDGKFLSTAKTTYTIEDEFDFEKPVRYGYEFINWIDENGNVVTGITKNSSGNKILTAQWKLINYNIAYNLDGGFYLGNTADITINGGNFVNTNHYEVPELNHESTGEYAIEIDGVEYQTLQEAINAAPADGTETVIEINKDINDGSGIKLQAGQNVVINFNGHTYTITNGLVGSKGTETLGMQLLKDSNLVMNDGMITTSMPTCRMLIQRYGDVVLNNMIIDGSKARNCSYVVSSNCGTMIVTGSTQILAYKNKFAFDLYYGMSKVYDDGVSVIFDDNFTGFVQGKVEVGYASRAKNMDWGSKTKLEIDNGTFDITMSVQDANVNPTKYTVESDEIILIDPVKPGYTFAGWQEKSETEPHTPNGIAAESTEDKEFTAVWTENEYSIEFELNGGKFTEDADVRDSYTINSDTYVLPEPVKEGYTFKGWTTDDSAENPAIVDTLQSGSSGDRKYTALWDIVTYDITYKYNGGIFTGNINVNINEEARFGVNSGYEELELSSESTGENAIEINGVAYNTLQEAINTVPLDGTETTIDINEDIADGSGFKIQSGQNIVLNFNGHTYNISDNLVGSKGTETCGMQILKDSNVVMQNGKITATTPRCRILMQRYGNVTLDNMIIDASDAKYCGYAVSSNYGTLTVTGASQIIASAGKYAFDLYYGMSKVYENGVAVIFDDDFTGYVEGKVEVTKASRIKDTEWGNNVELSMNAGVFNIDMTFEAEDSNPKQYTAEDEFTLNNPVKPNYTFEGWKETEDSEPHNPYNVTLGTTGDKHFEAVWSENEYSIEFDLNGGEFTEDADIHDSYTISSDTYELPEAVREGYTFTGWTTDNSVEDPVTVNTLPSGSAGNKKFTAVWDLIDYDITYEYDGGIFTGGINVDIGENARFGVNSGYKTPELSSESTGDNLIEIDGEAYDTLQDAINEAPTDGTETVIDINEDIEDGAGFKIQSGQNIIIDFNGHTYNISDNLVGSKGTETCGMQILKDSDVVMRNGKITTSTQKCRILMQRYGNVTLEDMIIDASGGKNCGYAVSSNYGTLTVTGASQIIASEGRYAFDLYYGMSKAYENGVAVIFDDNFTGYVEGMMEVTKASRIKDTEWGEKVELAMNAGTFNVEMSFEADDINPDTYTIEDGFTLNNPVKPNYTFVGWQEAEDDESNDPYEIAVGTTGDKHFKAIWESNKTVTLSYNF